VREIAKNVYRIVGARSVYQTIMDNLCPDGRVHPKIGFTQATGRWSVTSPGLTVLGKRGGRHVERAVLLPDPGEVLISVDLSQVDMRAVAGLSQDQGYIQMLMSEDPHTELALALFGDAGKREIAKAVGHGWNYGESLKRISMENEIEPALVNRFDRSMRDRFGRLVEWREEVRALAESGALLDNGFGRMMRPDPQRAHTQGPALMGQGAARDLMMTGLLRLPTEILPMLRAQVHDEIVLSVPEADHVEIGRTVVAALSFEWRGVPILADVSRPGTDWSKCYEK
jgi:DNA polymerase-1